MHLWSAALLSLCVACNAGTPVATAPHVTARTSGPIPCGLPHALGELSQMTIAPGATDSVSTDVPQMCGTSGWSGGAYIRVHGHGERHLDYARLPGPCDTPDADAQACPTVSIHAFAAATLAALHRSLGETHADGLGLGVCGEFSGPLSAWNVSSRVHDWRYVDEALRTIDSELRRWNLGDDYGLSVSGLDCLMPL